MPAAPAAELALPGGRRAAALSRPARGARTLPLRQKLRCGILLALVTGLQSSAVARGEPSPTSLRVNYRVQAGTPGHLVAVDRAEPIDFSWGFLPEARGNNQTYYQLLVSTRNNFSAFTGFAGLQIVSTRMSLCCQQLQRCCMLS